MVLDVSCLVEIDSPAKKKYHFVSIIEKMRGIMENYFIQTFYRIVIKNQTVPNAVFLHVICQLQKPFIKIKLFSPRKLQKNKKTHDFDTIKVTVQQ